MKYKITVSAIVVKPVEEEVYLDEEERKALDTNSRYAKKYMPKEVEEKMYEQVLESEINLLSIIKAFNETKE